MRYYLFYKILKLLTFICIVGLGNFSYSAKAADTAKAAEAAEDADTKAAEAAEDADTKAAEAAEDADTKAEDAEAAEAAENEHPCGSIQTIDKLQLELTNADDKASLLNELASLEDENLQKCLCTNTDRELMAVTVFDLSRHTNTDLAKGAQTLATRFNSVSCVNQMINSKAPGHQVNITMFLLRIEPNQAREIFDEASFPEDQNQDKDYMEKIIFGAFIPGLTPSVLIPTASEEGDRYYVKAQWDPKNQEQLQCLTELFKNNTLAERSTEEEKKWMEKLNGTRWIYWYSKEWAIGLGRAITECGGKASFVKGPNI